MKHTAQSVSVLAATTGVALLLLLPAGTASAASTDEAARDQTSALSPVTDYFANWFKRVDLTRAEQPHWATPIATTSPCLQEVLRYDISQQQSMRNGHDLTSFGSGKALELILAEPIQLNISVPAWQTLNTSPAKTGWADENFLLKYRLFAANEQQGNYALSLFAGLTAPTGSENFTSHHFTFTSGIAFGKGWGDFDFQSTVGVSIPDNGATSTGAGTPLLVNAVLQYRVAKVFWPEVEANYSYWPNGKNEGLNQLFITPGIVLGRFPMWRRLAVLVGVGCQFAVTDNPLYRRNYILTARLPF